MLSLLQILTPRRCSALLAFLHLFTLSAVFPARCQATVFYARDELMHVAFPDVEEVEALDFFLTPAQRHAIEELAGSKLDSDLVTLYVGLLDGRARAYAALDTRVVRTMPETLLIVMSPEGTVEAIHMIAFYEPLDYLPSDRWLEKLKGHELQPNLRVGQAIAGITGSTLSSHAVVSGVRRALAFYKILIAEAP